MGVLSDYAELYRDVLQMTNEDLAKAADGCTELSCPYHGVINKVRIDRGIHPRQTS